MAIRYVVTEPSLGLTSSEKAGDVRDQLGILGRGLRDRMLAGEDHEPAADGDERAGRAGERLGEGDRLELRLARPADRLVLRCDHEYREKRLTGLVGYNGNSSD